MASVQASSIITSPSDLPPELFLQIVSLLLTDAKGLVSLLRLNRSVYQFIKDHEESLVYEATKLSDPLVYKYLFLSARPTFRDHFNFQRQDRILKTMLKRACSDLTTRTNPFRNLIMYGSSSHTFILRCGLLSHYQITKLSTTRQKASYIRSLSPVHWICLNLLMSFLLGEIRLQDSLDADRFFSMYQSLFFRFGFSDFILETSLYSDLHSIEDFLTTKPWLIVLNVIQGFSVDWIFGFQSKHLRKGRSVVVTKNESWLGHPLSVHSCLSKEMIESHGKTVSIAEITLCCDDQTFFTDLLGALVIAPETTLRRWVKTFPPEWQEKDIRLLSEIKHRLEQEEEQLWMQQQQEQQPT